jgi:hypothetical protein
LLFIEIQSCQKENQSDQDDCKDRPFEAQFTISFYQVFHQLFEHYIYNNLMNQQMEIDEIKQKVLEEIEEIQLQETGLTIEEVIKKYFLKKRQQIE